MAIWEDICGKAGQYWFIFPQVQKTTTTTTTTTKQWVWTFLRCTHVFIGKELFACQSAVKDFHTILHTIGGDKEKERAR